MTLENDVAGEGTPATSAAATTGNVSTTTAIITPSDIIAKWFNRAGGAFVRNRRASKIPTAKNWTQTPINLIDITRHIRAGGNVGLLTGAASGGLCLIDLDSDLSGFLARFPYLAGAPRVARQDAPERGKIVIRLIGDIPPSRTWRVEGGRSLEFLADRRQGVIAGVHPDGARYELHNADTPIPALAAIDVAAIWRQWTGETMGAPAGKGRGGSGGGGGAPAGGQVTPATAAQQEEFRALLVELGAIIGSEEGQILVRCPFHDDKDPSLSINLEGAVFYCHAASCKVSGGLAALRDLARRRFGILSASDILEHACGFSHDGQELPWTLTPEDWARCPLCAAHHLKTRRSTAKTVHFFCHDRKCPVWAKLRASNYLAPLLEWAEIHIARIAVEEHERYRRAAGGAYLAIPTADGDTLLFAAPIALPGEDGGAPAEVVGILYQAINQTPTGMRIRAARGHTAIAKRRKERKAAALALAPETEEDASAPAEADVFAGLDMRYTARTPDEIAALASAMKRAGATLERAPFGTFRVDNITRPIAERVAGELAKLRREAADKWRVSALSERGEGSNALTRKKDRTAAPPLSRAAPAPAVAPPSMILE